MAEAAKRNNRLTLKVPKQLNEIEREEIKGIVKLLDPLSILTDTLQSDGVTYSLVIPGLLDAINSNILLFKRIIGSKNLLTFIFAGIDKIAPNAELVGFKKELLKWLINRFTFNKEGGEKYVVVEQETSRNIYTTNVLKGRAYVLASLLDNRIKDKPFSGIYNII